MSNKMKHTPGPWIVEDNPVSIDLEGENTVIVYCPEGVGYGRVAMVYAECGRVDELEPNARLIAAAPDMLETLEFVLDELSTMLTSEFARGADRHARKRIADAITKATED